MVKFASADSPLKSVQGCFTKVSPLAPCPLLYFGGEIMNIMPETSMSRACRMVGVLKNVGCTYLRSLVPLLVFNGDQLCGCIEIKCPFSAREKSIADACSQFQFCKRDSSNKMRTHNYYYQVQGQLTVLNLPWCDFVVWTNRDFSVERVNYSRTSIIRTSINRTLDYPDLKMTHVVHLIRAQLAIASACSQLITHIDARVNVITHLRKQATVQLGLATVCCL